MKSAGFFLIKFLSIFLEEFPDLHAGINESHWSIFLDINFGNLSIKEVAEKRNLSHERIRQINNEVLLKIILYIKLAFRKLKESNNSIGELNLQIAEKDRLIQLQKNKTDDLIDDPMPTFRNKDSVELLDIPLRIRKVLEELNIKTIAELINTPKSTLLSTRNFGQKSLADLQKALNKVGIDW